MHIGIITYSLRGPGGIEGISRALTAGLAASGHAATVICNSGTGPIPGIEQIELKGNRRTGSMRHLAFRSASAKMKRRMYCDLWHSFGMTSPCEIFAAQSCHKSGLATLRRYRRSFVENPFGAGIANRLALWQERTNFLGRGVRKIIACSRRTRDEIIGEYGVAGDRITVIPNGVDFTRFTPDEEKLRTGAGILDAYSIPQDEPKLLFVGNEFSRKGLTALIRALPLVQGFHPHLLVAGRASDRNFRRLATDLGIDDRVHFFGTVDRPEILMAAADLFVLPTLHEAFGLVILESMAMGLPVLASKTAGAVEDLGREGENVVGLGEPDNPEEIAASVGRILSDTALRDTLRKNGMETARKYSWEYVVRETLKVYEEVINM